MSDAGVVFERLRAETATMLGFDLDHLGAAQAVRLDRAIALRIEIDRLQSQQLRGESIDIVKLTSATEHLEKLLPAEDHPTFHDLSRLTTLELRELERLLRKTSNTEETNDGYEAEVEQHNREYSDYLKRLNDELVELRTTNTTQKIELESQRTQIRKLEAAAIQAMPSEVVAEVEDQPAEPTPQTAPREPSGPPAHYLRSGNEPWRPYVAAEYGARLPHPP
jgi:hypothetical protein